MDYFHLDIKKESLEVSLVEDDLCQEHNEDKPNYYDQRHNHHYNFPMEVEFETTLFHSFQEEQLSQEQLTGPEQWFIIVI